MRYIHGRKTDSRSSLSLPASGQRVMECDQLDLAQPCLKEIIGRCDSIIQLKRGVLRAAPTLAIVLIRGESGTGKERVAQSLHNLSPRRSQPLIVVNCGAIPQHLIEPALFGHVKGAFTDARADKKGFFEEAHCGSIVLDEIAEMPLDAQVKLLRVLQESTFIPVGATIERKVDVRIIAATHQNLEEALRAGTLREDFYYRINQVVLNVPSLRERGPGDIRLLTKHFLNKVYPKVGLEKPVRITPAAMDCLCAHSWPGNVRELENVLTNLSFWAENGEITLAQVEEKLGIPRSLSSDLITDISNCSFEEFERLQNISQLAFLRSQALARQEFFRSQELERLAFVSGAIDREHGNRARAARRLNVTRSHLYRLLSPVSDQSVSSMSAEVGTE